MSGMIDTNLLLFAANEDCREHARAHDFVATSMASSNAWYLTEGIIYEFLRQATQPALFEHPLEQEQCLRFLRTLHQRENFSVLTAGIEHWSLLGQLLPQVRNCVGGSFADIRTYVLMREYGIRNIYTANSQFHEFADIQVINPLVG